MIPLLGGGGGRGWWEENQARGSTIPSGCTNTLETYAYNKQLQPAVIELGTSSNPAASYCLVYNYYGTSPTSCALPLPGTTNNGNVMGYWYQDNVNSSFSHTASYTYDNVNRLSAAAATGNSTYNLSFSYTSDGSNGQYGNLSCTAGSCKDLTFSASTNQITASGYTYDAAGDLTKDSSNAAAHTYQWDAEGRVGSVDSGSTWGFTYDGVGDRAQWAYSGGDYQHLYDPAGNWLGVAGSYSLVRLGGRQMVVYTSSTTWFNHINNLNSTTMYTNQSGTAVGDQAFYPWGDAWLFWGVGGYNFASLDYYDTNTTTALTPFRVFSPNLGRWHSPDPLGGDVTNPQSLNRYAYVTNNPTTLTDPAGLTNFHSFWWPGFQEMVSPYDMNIDTDPTDACAYYDTSDASCEEPPGLWNNGQPIIPGLSVSGIGIGGGGSGTTAGGTAGGGIPGTPNGFLEPETDVIDLNVVFSITSWGWPYIVACASNPWCAGAVAGAAIGYGGYQLYKYLTGSPAVPAVPVSTPQSKASSTTMHSDHPECDAQYERDANICRKRRTSTCWASAMERWVQCCRGSWVPPLAQ
jgi:RHS repeat-associated protein